MGILYFDHSIFCRCQHYCILIDSGVALESTFYFSCLDLMRLTTWHLWTLGLHGNYVRISVFSCNPTGSHNKMTLVKQLSNCLCDGHLCLLLAIGMIGALLNEMIKNVHLFSLWCEIIWWHGGSEMYLSQIEERSPPNKDNWHTLGMPSSLPCWFLLHPQEELLDCRSQSHRNEELERTWKVSCIIHTEGGNFPYLQN